MIKAKEFTNAIKPRVLHEKASKSNIFKILIYYYYYFVDFTLLHCFPFTLSLSF